MVIWPREVVVVRELGLVSGSPVTDSKPLSGGDLKRTVNSPRPVAGITTFAGETYGRSLMTQMARWNLGAPPIGRILNLPGFGADARRMSVLCLDRDTIHDDVVRGPIAACGHLFERRGFEAL